MGLSRFRRHAFVLLFGLSVTAFASVRFAISFDVPIKKEVVDFGLSENNPPGGQNLRIKLSCFLYQNFEVKEYDNEGEKGAQWVAIAPIQGGTAPACARTHANGERVIKWPEWSGYFDGVKGNLVFLNADDGNDGGMPFTIYDFRTCKMIFSDRAYDSGMWTRKVASSPFNHLRFSGAQDSDLNMTYLRVLGADCDLHLEKAACWEKVSKKLGLRDTQMPVCTDYEKISSRSVSAIAYPVLVSLFPRPITKTIAGPVKCWPAD
jgi:hypothetical protein